MIVLNSAFSSGALLRLPLQFGCTYYGDSQTLRSNLNCTSQSQWVSCALPTNHFDDDISRLNWMPKLPSKFLENSSRLQDITALVTLFRVCRPWILNPPGWQTPNGHWQYRANSKIQDCWYEMDWIINQDKFQLLN